MANTLEELLMSAEYIMAGGNEKVILCERGIRTFETSMRNTLDISAIPMLKSKTHLPVIVDPSHAAGIRFMVEPLTMAAIAAGADGVMIEVHNNPEKALCDGKQSLTPESFAELMKKSERQQNFSKKRCNAGGLRMKALVLAEKPSVARDIARVLKCSKKQNGALEGEKYIVTWALGHLVTLADPEEYDKKYKEWNLEYLPMLPKKMDLVVIKQTAKQYQAVKTQLYRKDVNEIIIATDAGREGELVARWILEKPDVKSL